MKVGQFNISNICLWWTEENPKCVYVCVFCRFPKFLQLLWMGNKAFLTKCYHSSLY